MIVYSLIITKFGLSLGDLRVKIFCVYLFVIQMKVMKQQTELVNFSRQHVTLLPKLLKDCLATWYLYFLVEER